MQNQTIHPLLSFKPMVAPRKMDNGKQYCKAACFHRLLGKH